MRPYRRASDNGGSGERPDSLRVARPKLRRRAQEKPMASRWVGDEIVPIVRRFVASEMVT
jgi:hypothetical protein